MKIIFQYPYYLIGILVVPFIMWVVMRVRKESSLLYSMTSQLILHNSKHVRKQNMFVHFLRFCAFLCILCALAQPLGSEGGMEYETKGIDIVLAIDISGSMRAEDFQPDNRLIVAKDEARRFILNRTSDRIGLVVFAQKSYTQCPLTLDYGILSDLLQRVEIGLVRDGTAIGLAIANAVNRLRQSEAKSKVIILLTDGENNSGQIDPLTAAEIAHTFNIKIYTIGVGRGGLVPYPIDDPVFGKVYKNVELNVDEVTLKEIARITEGQYFRARDRSGLREIYEQIDQMEKTDIKVHEYVNYKQLFQYPLCLAFLFLLAEIIFAYWFTLKIP